MSMAIDAMEGQCYPARSHEQFDLPLRSVLRREWGIEDRPQRFAQGSTALTWEVSTKQGPAIVKMSWDEPGHFLAGLRASQAVGASGVAAGEPIASLSGALVALVEHDQRLWPVAVLRRVDGTAAALELMDVRALGRLLARLHVSLLSCDARDAWTVADVVGHMRRGLSAAQPAWVSELVVCATRSVEAAYGARRLPRQVIRGDGPEIILTRTSGLAGVIDWGGIRYGSVADDIGCWTLHLGSRKGAYRDTRKEFLRGYTSVAQLTHEERVAVPLFEHLRLASRVCYVTDRNALANLRSWLFAWQAERQ